MKNILVIAPHADDETLGCGGTLLRHAAEGDDVHWLLATSVSTEAGYSAERVQARRREVETVNERYGFKTMHEFGYAPAGLDAVPVGELVGRLSEVFRSVRPQVVYLPYSGDAHSDHRVVFDAAASCTKWFRQPAVSRVLTYETLSETDAGIDPLDSGFRPNVFVDIASTIQDKIDIMRLFVGEVGEFPFPRSSQAIRALASVRGAASGYEAAEGFMLLRERM